MVEPIERDSVSVSLGASRYNLVAVEARATELDLNRSSYLQRLIELDIDNNLLGDEKKIKKIKGNNRYEITVIDTVFVCFFVVIILLILSVIL
jgi:hypothetical protein